ncbi:MAG: twin-arginine translocation pathway signal protein [Proteobacteria bacterium]|nr:twin-arginine translocation pathway signal protein [Pseudomonadota bacterium]
MSLPRRKLLSVLGGGAIAAAAATVVAPRLDAMPAEAIEGWRGPRPGEPDPRRRALAWALLAPSPHNLQSWSVDLSVPGEVRLFVDRGRLLPETDPFSRQIMIGQGCFLEILSMAAAADGWRTETRLFPDGDWRLDRPVATVAFLPATPVLDPLFREVPRRRTVKSAYQPRDLDPAHRAALLAVAAPGFDTDITGDAGRVADLRRVAIAGSELEMNTPRTHKESIDVARIGARAVAEHRDGITLLGPMIWALRQAGQMTPEKAMTPGTLAWQGGRDYTLAGYASARAFGWLASPDNSRATQVACGRQWVRLQLAASALGVSLQPHSQALQEYPEMAALRDDMRRATGVADGRTLQMFFRLGYAAPANPSPRRPLDSFVTA